MIDFFTIPSVFKFKVPDKTDHRIPEILHEMVVHKIIYKTEMKFWAVLGSRGCREKKGLGQL